MLKAPDTNESGSGGESSTPGKVKCKYCANNSDAVGHNKCKKHRACCAGQEWDPQECQECLDYLEAGAILTDMEEKGEHFLLLRSMLQKVQRTQRGCLSLRRSGRRWTSLLLGRKECSPHSQQDSSKNSCETANGSCQDTC